MFCFSNQNKGVFYLSCLSISLCCSHPAGNMWTLFCSQNMGMQERSKPGPKYISCCPPYSGSVWCLIWAEQGKVVSSSWTAAWAVQENTKIFICRCLAAAWWILSCSSVRWFNVKLLYSLHVGHVCIHYICFYILDNCQTTEKGHSCGLKRSEIQENKTENILTLYSSFTVWMRTNW